MNYYREFLLGHLYRHKIVYIEPKEQSVVVKDTTVGEKTIGVSKEIEECRIKSTSLLKQCHDLITSDEWKVEKVTPSGDVVSSMVLPKPGGKIFKIAGTVDIPGDKLLNNLFDDIELSPSWNEDINESRRIHAIDDNTDLIYQASNSYGTIGARDFVILRHRGQYDAYHINGAISVNFSALPNRKNYVRAENGVGCFATRSLMTNSGEKCQFIFILNTNLKGWIPQKVVDLSLSSTLAKFMVGLRNHVQSFKD